ncbi:MAG: DNA polymerase IV [Candidatus Thiodiazotropha sp.]
MTLYRDLPNASNIVESVHPKICQAGTFRLLRPVGHTSKLLATKASLIAYNPTMPPRQIMHVDLDAFFASIEQRDHPEYQGRPLVVGAQPGQRGVVATCSYEARQYGVHSAMPISEAARRLPPEAVYVRPRISRYLAVSHKIMTILNQISPLVEPVSVDEAFLDISGLQRLSGSPEQIALRTKQLILEATGLTASVGIGPNRLIAKLASDFNKPDGLTLVPPDRVQAFLDPQPLSVLRGVGRKTAPLLQKRGLRSVSDVRSLGLTELRRLLGDLAGSRIHDQARGIASDRIVPGRARKSISKETTFSEDVVDPEALRDTLLWAAQEVGHIARQEGLKGLCITLKIRFRDFETHTRSWTLSTPTAADQTIFRQAWEGYQGESWGGRPVRLIGVGLSGWDSEETAESGQADLFGDETNAQADDREERLYQTLDEVSEKFGRSCVRFGLQRNKK